MADTEGAYLYQIGQRFFAIQNNDWLASGLLENCPDVIGNGVYISAKEIQETFYQLLQIAVDSSCGALVPSGNVATLISNTSEPVPPEIARCAKEGVEDQLAHDCYFMGGIIGASAIIVLMMMYMGYMMHRNHRLHINQASAQPLENTPEIVIDNRESIEDSPQNLSTP